MRLLVVEDDQALAKALRKGLVAHCFAVDVAGSAEHAGALLLTDPYDLVVLDLGLPGGDGLSLLRDLRARRDRRAVLILTARGSVEDRVTGLNAGGDDYLVKPFAFSEFVARINALLRRREATAPSEMRVGNLKLDPVSFRVSSGGRRIVLTVKEFSLLEYLIAHRGELVTRSMLLDHCWDNGYDGLSNLVDVHVCRLRRKLDEASASVAIQTIRGAGFVLEENRS